MTTHRPDRAERTTTLCLAAAGARASLSRVAGARRGLLCLAAVGGIVASLTACAVDEPAATLIIQNVTAIDAVNGARSNQTVALQGDRIIDVGEDVEIPAAAEVIDGTGQYLIPGLWDMHVHLSYDEAFIEAMPRLFLSYGVTSVRDTGGLLPELLPLVQAMRAEGAVAPRVFFSGPLLDGEFVVYDGDGRPEIGIGNPSVEAARANVASLKEAGVDFIKIYEMVSPEVFDALVEAAGEHGLPIAMHVPLSLRAGQVAPSANSMEHLRNIETDCAEDADALLATRVSILQAHEEGSGAGLRSRLHRLQRLPAIAAYDEARCAEVLAAMESTIQVPTLRLNALNVQSPFERDDWMEALDRAPAEVGEAWRATTEQRLANPRERDTTFGEWSLALIGWMHDHGVPIAAGTDTPISFALPGHSLHDELDMLVRAGLSPLEALRSATIRPAEFFGLENEMGRIEAGQRADLVLLSADPLADIANTRKIVAVVSRGRHFTPTELTAPVAR